MLTIQDSHIRTSNYDNYYNGTTSINGDVKSCYIYNTRTQIPFLYAASQGT